ncbi:MAG: helix-turn-helix transcriptional regulator [Streptomycetaceae bacterium]|nr:helix-turn-helix transcriptional regulator [Streptomycetaceae bacterium]
MTTTPSWAGPAEAGPDACPPPVQEVHGLVHFSDGATVYVGRHRHEDGYPVHTHSFVEVAVVVAGEGTHDCIAGAHRVAAGDALLLRAGAWHGYRDCTELEVVNCCFSNAMLRDELAWGRRDPALGHLLWSGPYAMDRRGILATGLAPPEFEECVGRLDAMSRALHRSGSASAEVIGHLLLFLSALASAAYRPDRGARRDPAPTHPAVAEGMRRLVEELAHPWTLGELADHLHVAPSYLVRLFKASVGLPPMAYLAQQRAEAASRLLLDTDLAVSKIGQTVGWPDANYFARRFKAHYGLTATEYRRRFIRHRAHRR